ncbi:hypothetical protein MGG_11952 [Pyricularia oryzae 70-15]|uniref:Uncharacterized protein n=1 Tax=Pyricularia oryzae (strain 70-15 / ATCC MYA-4617 / FGSC 8958) TaxID=242507 RepID=G4MQJ0_PYRO7|nr:uncharacterized protein MGG_11952 [Pyricularia oryzae 70-15]EHA56480.1 hypothetical protein MGG_11952 [Pyricularia oryzae 70-15]
MPQLLVAQFYWALVQKLEQDISAAVVDGVAHSPAMNHAAELQDSAQCLHRLPLHQGGLESPSPGNMPFLTSTPTVYQHLGRCHDIVWWALACIGHRVDHMVIGFFVNKSVLVVGVGAQD